MIFEKSVKKDKNKDFVNLQENKNSIFTKHMLLDMDMHDLRVNNNAIIYCENSKEENMDLVVKNCFIKPNILQANSNYIVADFQGELYNATGDFLKDRGYKVKVIDLMNISKSDCFNPFCYAYSNTDVIKMVKCFIKATEKKKAPATIDIFWVVAEEALLTALSLYVYNNFSIEKRNFVQVFELIEKALEYMDKTKSNSLLPLDEIFNAVQMNDANAIELEYYNKFKKMPEKALRSVMIGCVMRLIEFSKSGLKELISNDTVCLEDFAKGENAKQALFVIIPENDTFTSLISLLYMQLDNALNHAVNPNFSMKNVSWKTRFLLCGFPKGCYIDELGIKMTHSTSAGIIYNIIISDFAQFEKEYCDDWDTIVENADNYLLLSGNIENFYKKCFIKNENIDMKKFKQGTEGVYYFKRMKESVVDALYNVEKHPNYKNIKNK